MAFDDDDEIGNYRPSVETMANSAYNAYRAARQGKPGVGGGAEMKALDEDLREQWWVLAYRAEAILESKDGSPIADVTRAFYAAWSKDPDGYDGLPAEEKVAWEAVVKHLWKMLDAESQQEIDPLAALEMSWGPWAHRKLEGSMQ